MKLYERIENNNFDEIDRNRAIELIEGGNGHLVYNENYFKLQKENEILKEEKEQAWEEWNNLGQGSCETEQKLKQQIKKLQKENEELKLENKNIKEANYYWSSRYCNICNNSISKQKVKNKIEELKQEKEKYGNCLIKMYEDELVNRNIKILQELIEESEKK